MHSQRRFTPCCGGACQELLFRFCSASPLHTDLALILSSADECTLALLRGKDMECSPDQIECMFACLRMCVYCSQRWIMMKRLKRSACNQSVGSHHAAEELAKNYFFDAALYTHCIQIFLSRCCVECTPALLRSEDMECAPDQIECSSARLRMGIDCCAPLGYAGGMFSACSHSVGSHHAAEAFCQEFLFRCCSASALHTDLPLTLSLADEC